jgi:hypothetical protein
LKTDPALARLVRKDFEDFAPEFDAFSEAMARARYAYPPDTKIFLGMKQAPWAYWNETGTVLRYRAVFAISENNADQFTNDAATLVRLANHLRHDPSSMGVSISNGIGRVACILIGDGIDSGILDKPHRERLIRVLEDKRPPPAEAMTRILRFERGIFLQFVDKLQDDAEKAVDRKISIPGMGKAGRNVPRWLVRRATWWRMFFARNRLALCEDLQHCLLAPEGQVLETIRPEDLPRFNEACKKRFSDEDSASMEIIAGMFPGFFDLLVLKMDKTDKLREDVLARLRK